MCVMQKRHQKPTITSQLIYLYTNDSLDPLTLALFF
uniref:Uncharacterized protein n=1 Tax=Arundo donax TaxID=35708 RepID=A0A0A8XWK3_ARUDO